VRAIVLLQADDVGELEFALQVTHVADLGAAESVDRLVVVADRKEARRRAVGTDAAAAGQQLQPGILKAIGVLELVDQDVAEACLVMLAQGLVALQQLIRAQQQFGKINHALAPALRFIRRIQLDAAAGEGVVGFCLGGADPLLLVRVDEMHQLARRKFLVVDVENLQQALDRRQLVGRIENLELRRQSGLAGGARAGNGCRGRERCRSTSRAY
jgi:hypothetical protein